ncbi:MAG: hypothetical protein COS89_00675 [Deltaproteobacteria bacterium CG07_land_8_20_14_0_80_38_7]|nr:MAG: hypothetical protein COS89_00675 [Deltaproteobacteria bacterium CG07_land_8_20_14_0_80_38_7]
MLFSENLKKADINISSSGNNTIIAAPTTGYIAIDHINFLPTSAVTVQLKQGTTAYGGAYPLDAKQAYTIENTIGNEHGIITCLPGEAFVIDLGGAVQVGGFVRYRIVGE